MTPKDGISSHKLQIGNYNAMCPEEDDGLVTDKKQDNIDKIKIFLESELSKR